MPATKFICPNGERVPIKDCLASCKCKQKERCMFLPKLRAVAESLDCGIKEATVTELIRVRIEHIFGFMTNSMQGITV